MIELKKLGLDFSLFDENMFMVFLRFFFIILFPWLIKLVFVN